MLPHGPIFCEEKLHEKYLLALPLAAAVLSTKVLYFVSPMDLAITLQSRENCERNGLCTTNHRRWCIL